jgi:hypothetical protein
MRNTPPTLQEIPYPSGKPVMTEHDIVLELVVFPETLQITGEVRKMKING